MKAGLQLYSVRNALARDLATSLKKVAEAGYRYVEFANHRADGDPGIGFDIAVTDLRTLLDEFGLEVVGSHIFPMDAATIERVIAYHRELGSKYIGMALDFWADRAAVLQQCRFYNEVGEKCRAQGLTFCFHNHYHEFQLLDGERILDLIVQNTDPDFVSLELDAYWTYRAIEDPAAVIHEYGKRISIIHQKDYPLKEARTLDVWTSVDRARPVDRATFESAIDPQQFTELGTGMIKIQDVIDAGNEVGVEYLLVEQDHISGHDEFESIARDRENLSRLRGLDWA